MYCKPAGCKMRTTAPDEKTRPSAEGGDVLPADLCMGEDAAAECHVVAPAPSYLCPGGIGGCTGGAQVVHRWCTSGAHPMAALQSAGGGRGSSAPTQVADFLGFVHQGVFAERVNRRGEMTTRRVPPSPLGWWPMAP